MSLRALVVDDQGSFCDWATAWLEAHGFPVVGTASNGEEAIEAVRLFRPDVVLLDIQLPDIDGIEVAHRLAREPAPPEIVLISAREAVDYGRRLQDAPVGGFISKADLSITRFRELLPSLT